MSEYVKKDAAVAVVEERQKACCPVGRWSRHYANNREEFDAWQTVIDELAALPTVDAVPAGAYEQVRWERDVAIEQLEEDYGVCLGQKRNENLAEVTRCKDCKYGDYDSEPDDAMVCLRTNDGFWRTSNDFCSRGVPKEETHEDH